MKQDSAHSVRDRKNVIVTGGAGFLGSHLCEFLLERYNVICIDDYSSGKESNIDHLLSRENFEFIRHDVTQPLDLKALPGGERFRIGFVGLHGIFHLACSASPKVYRAQSIQTLMTNALGTRTVCEWAREFQARLVCVSDAQVYGSSIHAEHGASESALGELDYLSPRSLYAQAKRFSESIVTSYTRVYDMNTKIVRLYTTYGPHMHLDDGRMIPQLIAHALEGRDIVFPTNFPKGSFLYVSDAVDALQQILEYEDSGIFNLGHPTAYSFQEILEKIMSLTSSSSKALPGEPHAEEAELYESWLDSTGVAQTDALRIAVGWFPVVLPDEGLKRTIDFMKALRGVKTIVS